MENQNRGNVMTHSHRTCGPRSNCTVKYTRGVLNPSAALTALDMALALQDENVTSVKINMYHPDAEFDQPNSGMVMAWDMTTKNGKALKSKGTSGGVMPVADCNPRPGYRCVVIELARCDANAKDMEYAYELLNAGFQVVLYTDGDSFRVWPLNY